ncbi:hypothetical protein ACH5RR_008004 [Cinchona calisaya]|uniref:Uncharacterized protein n=1 Tax=Cinchona calisaya TaxID=153742 RepID=A0ABD3AD21_9GENT
MAEDLEQLWTLDTDKEGIAWGKFLRVRVRIKISNALRRIMRMAFGIEECKVEESGQIPADGQSSSGWGIDLPEKLEGVELVCFSRARWSLAISQGRLKVASGPIMLTPDAKVNELINQEDGMWNSDLFSTKIAYHVAVEVEDFSIRNLDRSSRSSGFNLAWKKIWPRKVMELVADLGLSRFWLEEYLQHVIKVLKFEKDDRSSLDYVADDTKYWISSLQVPFACWVGRFLEDSGIYESPKEAAKREEVLARLKQLVFPFKRLSVKLIAIYVICKIVKVWVKDVTRLRGYTDQDGRGC